MNIFHLHSQFHYPVFIFLNIIIYSSVLSASTHITTYEKTTLKALVEVMDDAVFAITERNMRVTGELHIGKAIRERGNKDFPDYEVIQFCNLSYAKEMLEMKPDYINYCPLKLTFRDIGEKILIAAPLLPESTENRKMDKLAVRINILIREIVDFAAEDWFVVYD